MKANVKPSILFVCTANIIRSPMAEAILKARMRRHPAFQGWQVASAGIYGLTGEPADPIAQMIMKEQGIDLKPHVARRFDKSLAARCDLILTMETVQKEALQAAFPELVDKIFVLSEAVGGAEDIQDPRSRPVEVYRTIGREIKRLIQVGFLWIILQALQNSLGHIERFSFGKDLLETDPKGLPESALTEIASRPMQIQYELLRFLLQLFPQHEQILREINRIVSEVSPSPDEEMWLRDIRLYEIVLPLTCLKMIQDSSFHHPEIQAKLNIIRSRLEKPEYQEMYQELEQLGRRDFPLFKYRLGVWDLKVKYPGLPFRVGDYEEAYRILHERKS